MLVTVTVVTIMQRYKLIYHLCKKSSFLTGLIVCTHSYISRCGFYKNNEMYYYHQYNPIVVCTTLMRNNVTLIMRNMRKIL